MKIVAALDSFKGSVSAPDACRALAAGIREVCPDVLVAERPMADGGEGTAAVLLASIRGEWVPREVTGPLPGRRVRAGYAWFPGTKTALVEMAEASGLARLDEAARDPMRTTTFGTGELIAAAMDRGAERVLLAVGGSATVDGGAGAAAALGWRMLDAGGRDLPPGGGALARLHAIRPGQAAALPPIDVLCDVTNPLLGEQGAAAVYGPQKGATPEMIPQLEAGLARFAACVLAVAGRDIRDVPGAGAAGGLAGGACGLLGARLVPGAEVVLEAIGLPEAMRGADWVVTGEGRFDRQSAQGKVVSAVARAGRAAGVRCAVVAGQVDVAPAEARRMGIEAVLQSAPPEMLVAEAMARGADLIRDAGRRFGRQCLGRE